MLTDMQRIPHRRAPPDPIRVLISDDHELIRIALTSVLSAAGMDVVASCGNGAEAIAATEALNPDVVIMDLSMPGIDGAEATRQILSIVPTTKVIILTARDHGEATDAALAAGALAVVFKDLGAQAVVAAIEALSPGAPANDITRLSYPGAAPPDYR